MVYEGIENFLNILWYNKISCNILFLHTWNFVFIIRSYIPISSFHVDKLEFRKNPAILTLALILIFNKIFKTFDNYYTSSSFIRSFIFILNVYHARWFMDVHVWYCPVMILLPKGFNIKCFCKFRNVDQTLEFTIN